MSQLQIQLFGIGGVVMEVALEILIDVVFDVYDELLQRMLPKGKHQDTLCMILKSEVYPSVPTVNWTITLPCFFSLTASAGYLMFRAMYFISSDIPPGYSGICSTTI